MKKSFILFATSSKPSGFYWFFVLLLFTTCNISCSKDDFIPDLDETPAWEPEIAFPLAYAEMGMSDLARVNDSSTILIVDNDQFCTLIYKEEVFNLLATELVQLPNQSHQSQFNLNNGEILTLNNIGNVQLFKTQDINFSVSQGMEIDSLVLKNSQLVIDCSSDLPADADVRITIPGLVKNGIVFSELIPLNYSGGSSTSNMLTIPLHNYQLDLTKNGTTTNTLAINFAISINGNSGSVSTANTIQCAASFQSLQYKIIYGYIGQQSLSNLADSVELSIFNNASGIGNFSIAEPKINFDISNSLGIPFYARISQLTALNSNQTSFTVATGIPDPLPVNSPTINQIGQQQHTSFTLDKNNSNINTLISEKPRYLIVQSQVSTNPNGPGINFLTDSSRLTMNVAVELPLYGTASDFKITDTVQFNYNDLENVETLTLRMNIENWFPLDAGVQLIFTDANYLPLDTLFLPGEVIIPSGIITGNNGRVTIAGKKIRDHQFDKTRIQKILNAKYILVEVTAATYQQGTTNVKIFNDYKLKLKIGAIAKLKIQ